MRNKSFTINLKCFFCGSHLEGDAEKKYSSGDMLRCQNCQELNDYDALIDVVVDEGKALIVDHAKDEIRKMLKKLKK